MEKNYFLVAPKSARPTCILWVSTFEANLLLNIQPHKYNKYDKLQDISLFCHSVVHHCCLYICDVDLVLLLNKLYGVNLPFAAIYVRCYKRLL